MEIKENKSSIKKLSRLSDKAKASDRGCQILLGATYQNGKNVPNNHKLHLQNGHKIYRMAVK
jgi:hypothetical protein